MGKIIVMDGRNDPAYASLLALQAAFDTCNDEQRLVAEAQALLTPAQWNAVREHWLDQTEDWRDLDDII